MGAPLFTIRLAWFASMFGSGVAGTGLSIGRRLSRVAGFFSGWRLLWLIIPVASVLTGAGFWAGTKWSNGLNAIGELAALDRRIERLDRSLERNDESAQRFERTRNEIDQFYRARDADFRAWTLANRDRLAACGIGADGLRLWNLWNEGSATGTDPR